MPVPPLPDADLDHILRHTEAMWHELRGARIFITGGTGFFGIWLLESLARANERLNLNIRATVLSRDPKRFLDRAPHLAIVPIFDWLRGDITNFDFPAGSFSHVIHAATEASATLNESQPLAMFDTAVSGTRRVLEFAAACGAGDLLLTSSGAVYGPQPAQIDRLPEDYMGGPSTNTPASAYGEGKRAAELLCAIYARDSGLRPKIARCFAFVGPHLPLETHFAIGNFIADGLAGREIRIQGDGRAYRSYLYAADLAIWLWTILIRGAANRPYNVGSEDAVTIQELAQRVSAHCGEPSPDIRILGKPGKGPVARYVPATPRAEVELGLKPLICLNDAISKTIAWGRIQ